MKRSQINNAVRQAKSLMAQYHFHLPSFAQYSLEDWHRFDLQTKREILEARLGWDVTDFNLGQFEQLV